MTIVVTLSASFGTYGGIVGRRVAERLDIPFIDRAIPTAVAESLGVPLSDALEQDERAATGLRRLISSMALVPDLTGGEALAYSNVADERLFKERTEEVLRQIASTTGGVILGRAGAVVLRDVPGAVHVRLTGKEELRIEHLARTEGISIEHARELVERNDKARLAYGKTFYRCDLSSPQLYQVVIDPTAIELEAVTEMIVIAAGARLPS